MRAVVVLVAALALGGCRGDDERVGPDLSSPSLYCPPSPPLTTPFACDRTSIPYCTYPTEQITCVCKMGGDGIDVLVCAPVVVDGGATRD